MKINYEAILKKVEQNPNVKRSIENKKRKMGNGDGTVYQKVNEVAFDFGTRLSESITELRAADGFENGFLGTTAVDALLESMHQNVVYIGDNRYRIYTYFDDIHRESLVPGKYPRGVDNLAVLLNSGYDAGHTVRGVWHGHGEDEIHSLAHREGAHFIETAIKDFEQNFERNHKGVRLLNITHE